MNQVIVYYNPFLPELKISVNGKKMSQYSSLMSFRHQRIENWACSLFPELYREVNDDYEMTCISSEFVCGWLEVLAEIDSHCAAFSTKPLQFGSNVYERLDRLETLGCNEPESPLVIPVFNASENDGMIGAVYEILEEQGLFEGSSEDGFAWDICPLACAELRTCSDGDDVSRSNAVIAFCSSENDRAYFGSDVPVFALVMGSETKFIKRQSHTFYFSVDPDDIGTLLMGVIEEIFLCPLLSELSYNFSAEAKAFLTDEELAELDMICQTSPTCRVTIPRTCDTGRTVKLDAVTIPSEYQKDCRAVSDDRSIIDTEGCALHPLAVGAAEVSVYLGDDPYPVASETVEVRTRELVTDISLFPSVMYLPEGGQGSFKVTVTPDTAENTDEIRWESDDASVASVDSVSGEITAVSLGKCIITASTHEASKSVCVEVQPEIESIILPFAFIEIGVGEQRECRFQIVPENAYGADLIRVMSSNISVAEYRGGYVLGKSVGECRLFLKDRNGTISRELKVIVKKSRKFH